MAIQLEIPWFENTSRTKRFLVGVSGGADSVALLHLLVEAGFRKLVVCHLNHRLRGRAAAADARFVQQLADHHGLTCEIGHSDVRARMKQNQQSMETAARAARHEFFAQCATQHRCRRLVLAHHADDQAETVLWNLLRGSHGLKGMRLEQTICMDGIPLSIARPLLELRHADLVAWLKSRDLPWREDASNAESITIRNRLRNEAFPLLAAISGRDAVAAFARGAADCAEREDSENAWINQANLLDPQGRLHLAAMRKLPLDLQRTAFRKFLMQHGVAPIDRALLQRATDLLDTTQASSVNLPGQRKLRRREGRVWIESVLGNNQRLPRPDRVT